MKSAKDGVTVTILGKDYLVACPPEARAALDGAARYLDAKMREVQDVGRVIGSERCAVMAALNIANELLESRKNGQGPKDLDKRLKFLHSKIDTALRDDLGVES